MIVMVTGRKHVPIGSCTSFLCPIRVRVTISGYSSMDIVANRGTGDIVHNVGIGFILESMYYKMSMTFFFPVSSVLKSTGPCT